MRGAAGAPARIREALWSDSSNPWSERGVDVSVPGLLEDGGDISVGEEPAAAREAIEAGIVRLLDQGICPIALGGDHSVTYPIVRAYRGRVNGLTIVHVDAHTDLYDEFQGDRYSHACPFARIMEEGLAERLVQIGIRTASSHQRQQAAKFGAEIYDMSRWSEAPLERSRRQCMSRSISTELTRLSLRAFHTPSREACPRETSYRSSIVFPLASLGLTWLNTTPTTTSATLRRVSPRSW